MLVTALYVHEARFGARVAGCARVAKPLPLRYPYVYAMQSYLNTRRLPYTVDGSRYDRGYTDKR